MNTTNKILASAVMVFFMIEPSAKAKAQTQPDYLTPYAQLLAKHITPGKRAGITAALVDYDGWSRDKRHARAMRALQQVNPRTLRGKDKLAFWINAYNLLTLDLLIQTGERETILNQGSFWSRVWKVHHWTIGGMRYTLHQIEHEILRRLGEPRIHFAINCASMSCPDLLDAPYRARTLDAQLERQTKLFLREPAKGLKMESDGIRLSKIFDWFEEDFGKDEKQLKLWLRAYVPAVREATEIVGYFDYNWTLNCSSCEKKAPASSRPMHPMKR